MSLSTGTNFDKVLQLLSEGPSDNWNLESKIPSESTLNEIPPHVADEFHADGNSSQQVCDWPVFDEELREIKIYFSCCCQKGTVLILKVQTRYPDLLKQHVLDLVEKAA